jgi:hypothetical protein
MKTHEAPSAARTAPKVGQVITVHGVPCRIFKVRPFGTVDVVALDDSRAFRVSGLGF